jgi:RNA polymerase sigma factor (sigma-70 family)
VNSLTDQQLLRDYTGHRSETAFAELVRRHVDFVYSAALRMVRDTHLAEDVTQGVFVALAQNARQLTDHPVLSGWLHRTTQNLAANTVRSEVRRRAREQEAVAMNELLAPEPEAAWEHIAPQLDAALGELNEPDRDALLLRYFERKSTREMAQTLGTSEDAAQKRVSRAVERLREFLSKRGVTVGASGLVIVISANAVQAAPAGLAVTISAAAIFAGTAVSTSTAIAATKIIAMTTLQKTVVTATVAVLAGAGIYEARQASQLRGQVQMLQQQQAPLAGQVQQLQRERDDATNQLAGLLAENSRLQSNPTQTELLKLRGEVGVLRQKANNLAQLVRDLQNVGKQNSSAYQTNFFPLGSLQFAGFATPEAALQSGLWAKITGNEKVWLDGMAPDMADGAKNKYVQGKSDDERSRFLISQTTNWMGGRILNEIPLTDDEVLIPTEVEVLVNGATNTFTSMEVLKKIAGEWKLFDEYNENGLKPKAP